MSLERVYFSPERFTVDNLTEGDTFCTPSGLGGTYDVRFVGLTDDVDDDLVFELTSGEDVEGKHCVVPFEEAPFRLFTHRDRLMEHMNGKTLPGYAIDRTYLSTAVLTAAAVRAGEYKYVVVHMPKCAVALNLSNPAVKRGLSDKSLQHELQRRGFAGLGESDELMRKQPIFIECLEVGDVVRRLGVEDTEVNRRRLQLHEADLLDLPASIFHQEYYEADARYRRFETSPTFIPKKRVAKDKDEAIPFVGETSGRTLAQPPLARERGASAQSDPIREAIRLGRDSARVELYMMTALLDGSGVVWNPEEIRRRFENTLAKLGDAVEACDPEAIRTALHAITKPLSEVVTRCTVNKVETATQLAASLKWAEIHGVESPRQTTGRHR